MVDRCCNDSLQFSNDQSYFNILIKAYMKMYMVLSVGTVQQGTV